MDIFVLGILHWNFAGLVMTAFIISFTVTDWFQEYLQNIGSKKMIKDFWKRIQEAKSDNDAKAEKKDMEQIALYHEIDCSICLDSIQ